MAKNHGKDKSNSNPLVPLLDQEKHFFELTKQLMQPTVSTTISVYPVDKLDQAYRCLADTVILSNRNHRNGTTEEVSQ